MGLFGWSEATKHRYDRAKSEKRGLAFSNKMPWYYCSPLWDIPYIYGHIDNCCHATASQRQPSAQCSCPQTTHPGSKFSPLAAAPLPHSLMLCSAIKCTHQHSKWNISSCTYCAVHIHTSGAFTFTLCSAISVLLATPSLQGADTACKCATKTHPPRPRAGYGEHKTQQRLLLFYYLWSFGYFMYK